MKEIFTKMAARLSRNRNHRNERESISAVVLTEPAKIHREKLPETDHIDVFDKIYALGMEVGGTDPYKATTTSDIEQEQKLLADQLIRQLTNGQERRRAISQWNVGLIDGYTRFAEERLEREVRNPLKTPNELQSLRRTTDILTELFRIGVTERALGIRDPKEVSRG